MRLEECKPGMRVVYRDFGREEVGRISSRNDTYAFVRFDEHVRKFGWDGATSQACDPRDLEPKS